MFTAVRQLLLPDDPSQWRVSGPVCYTLYSDRADVPLYVGSTGHLSNRLHRHRFRAWWPLVDVIAIDRYDSRAAARAAEAHLIIEAKPLFNVVGNRHAA